jgi:hypothetical protein
MARPATPTAPRRSTPTIFPANILVPGTITHCPECDRQPALQVGVRVPARPHLGTAGVAPDVPGRVSTIPPGAHGGNIDNWRIGAGATMYYPVQVDGGLFSIGDPHVSQGDGELSGTAIEASLNVLFQIVRAQGLQLPSPLLETPRWWIVHGFDEDLNVAMRNASLDMLQLLTEHRGCRRNDAYSLMSVAADFAVTQVVDGRQGVHVRILDHGEHLLGQIVGDQAGCAAAGERKRRMAGAAAQVQRPNRPQPLREGFEPIQIGALRVHAAVEIVRCRVAELARCQGTLIHTVSGPSPATVTRRLYDERRFIVTALPWQHEAVALWPRFEQGL